MASSAMVTAAIIFGLVMMFTVQLCTAQSVLGTNQVLPTGGSLRNGAYRFTIQADCNLVLYDNGRAVWATGTNGKAQNCFLRMQSDGNLVVYGFGRAIWASNTARTSSNYYLILQPDRNVVIYNGANGAAIWATNTNVRGAPITIVANDVGLAEKEKSSLPAAGVAGNTQEPAVGAANTKQEGKN